PETTSRLDKVSNPKTQSSISETQSESELAHSRSSPVLNHSLPKPRWSLSRRSLAALLKSSTGHSAQLRSIALSRVTASLSFGSGACSANCFAMSTRRRSTSVGALDVGVVQGSEQQREMGETRPPALVVVQHAVLEMNVRVHGGKGQFVSGDIREPVLLEEETRPAPVVLGGLPLPARARPFGLGSKLGSLVEMEEEMVEGSGCLLSSGGDVGDRTASLRVGPVGLRGRAQLVERRGERHGELLKAREDPGFHFWRGRDRLAFQGVEQGLDDCHADVVTS
ncbi:hypothetical protein CTA1_107, partial [Colletotrichum tanaceti]